MMHTEALSRAVARAAACGAAQGRAAGHPLSRPVHQHIMLQSGQWLGTASGHVRLGEDVNE